MFVSTSLPLWSNIISCKCSSYLISPTSCFLRNLPNSSIKHIDSFFLLLSLDQFLAFGLYGNDFWLCLTSFFFSFQYILGSLELLKVLHGHWCSKMLRGIYYNIDIMHVVINVMFEAPPYYNGGRVYGVPPPPILMFVGGCEFMIGILGPLFLLAMDSECIIRFLLFDSFRFLLRSPISSLHSFSLWSRSAILVPQSLFSSSNSFAVSFTVSFYDFSLVYLNSSLNPFIIPSTSLLFLLTVSVHFLVFH